MHILICLLFVSLPAFATPTSVVAAGDGESANHPPFLISLRGGFLLNNPDQATIRKWEHQPTESYQLGLSGFYSFPRAWNQFRFFAGPEFTYQSASEELSGPAYTATLDISVYRFWLTGGADWRPSFLGGDWGASLATAFEVFGRKTTALDAQGFTQDLGTEDTQNGQLLMNFNVILTLYYEISNFRPQLIVESNSSIGMGVGYAF